MRAVRSMKQETVKLYADHWETGERRVITVTAESFREWNTAGARKRNAPWVTVHDLSMRVNVQVRAADCGAACFCAAEWRQV